MTVQEDMEYRLSCLIRELDEICAIAADPKTSHLVAREHLAVCQMYTRCALLSSFLRSRNLNGAA